MFSTVARSTKWYALNIQQQKGLNLPILYYHEGCVLLAFCQYFLDRDSVGQM